jgi:predicted RNA binding protein YcfA (HicA-like mRNA interferase family)
MPARFGDIIRILRSYGIQVLEPKSGSHWIARSVDGKIYPVPAHNGPKNEIADEYIRGLCRKFNIDLKEFKEKL